METEKRPKWDIGVAIEKGNQTIELIEKYRTDIEARLQPDELEQHRSNTVELATRRAGQQENLVNQKSKTLGQDEAIDALYNSVISIRGIVKCNNLATAEITKAYGVGEKASKTVSGVITAGNIIIAAYNTYTSWSNHAGIIEADITEIHELIASLSQADGVQETSKFSRKSKTMDKNSLQRAVEDEVSKISALGMHIFRIKNPAVAALFAGLIPGSAKPEAKTEASAESNV